MTYPVKKKKPLPSQRRRDRLDAMSGDNEGHTKERSQAEERALVEWWSILGTKGASLHDKSDALLGFFLLLAAEIEKAEKEMEETSRAYHASSSVRAELLRRVRAAQKSGIGESAPSHLLVAKIFADAGRKASGYGAARSRAASAHDIMDRMCAVIFEPPKAPSIVDLGDAILEYVRYQRDTLTVGETLITGEPRTLADAKAEIVEAVRRVLPPASSAALADAVGQKALHEALTARPTTRGAPKKGDARIPAAKADGWLLRVLGINVTPDALRKARGRRLKPRTNRTRRSP